MFKFIRQYKIISSYGDVESILNELARDGRWEVLPNDLPDNRLLLTRLVNAATGEPE